MGLPVRDAPYYPTPDELRSQMLAEIRWMYHHRGLVANVAEGSELYIRYNTIANRVCVALENNRLSAQNMSPLTATGAELLTLAATVGVYPRPASKASGYIIVGVGGPVGHHVTIPAGFIWTPPGGIEYETTGSYTVADGEPVEVIAKTGGEDSERDPGVMGNWESAAIGLLELTAVTDTAGLTGGHNADSEEDIRRRLLRKLKAPAVGGNAASVCEWAEESSAAVDASFCYGAVRGPSSLDVAIMQQESVATLSLTVINSCAAYLQTKMPGSVNINVTTVSEQIVDICINTKLPLPTNAGGAGGGWRDAVPWPTSADAANTYCEILAVVAHCLDVNSTAADIPVVGKHIALWNPVGGDDGEGAMIDFTITNVTVLGPPHYRLWLDCTSDALSFVVPGMLVSAAAYNLTAYVKAFRDALAGLGPGEKTANVDLLPQALRFPGPDTELPSDLTSVLLDAITSSFPEVKDLAYAATYAAGTGESGTSLWTDRSSPSIPATTAQPPRILKLGALSFRRKI